MASVQLTAGALSVDVTGDGEPDESAEDIARIARDCMDWQMEQWSDVSGKCVTEHSSSAHLR